MAHNWSRKVLVRIDAAAVVDIAGADVEQGVAAEQRRLLGVGKQADVAHRVAGRVEAFQLHRLADLDDIASLHAPVDTGDLAARAVVGDQLGAAGRHAGRVAAGDGGGLTRFTAAGTKVPTPGIPLTEPVSVLTRKHLGE